MSNEQLAEALLRRIVSSDDLFQAENHKEGNWRQALKDQEAIINEARTFLRALDAAPAEDTAALVAVGAAYVKLRHLDERLSPASIDEDRAAAIALDDAYAAYRKAPVQG